MNARSDAYRRVFDIVASAVLGLVVLPVVLLAALGSAIAFGANPFFVQDRVGRGGELFRVLKIRTLSPTVPAYADKHELRDYGIPAFCRLLRKLHLDELPQLYLVLRGDMSLVGPRPEMPHLHERMPRGFAVERTTVRPGCTGMWQISDACSGLIEAAPEYDRFYLAHRSMRLDLWVLYRTALKMSGLSDGVTIDQAPAWVLARPRRATGVFDGERQTAAASVLDLHGEPREVAADAALAVSGGARR